MKNFDDWKAEMDERVKWADEQITKLSQELDMLRQLRDAWALSSYPMMRSGAGGPPRNLGAGMEDCGK